MGVCWTVRLWDDAQVSPVVLMDRDLFLKRAVGKMTSIHAWYLCILERTQRENS